MRVDRQGERQYAEGMLGVALVHLLVAGGPQPADEPQPVDAGIHRGTGWYSADVAVPEPPVALALVIVAAAGMRARERRRQSRAG